MSLLHLLSRMLRTCELGCLLNSTTSMQPPELSVLSKLVLHPQNMMGHGLTSLPLKAGQEDLAARTGSSRLGEG